MILPYQCSKCDRVTYTADSKIASILTPDLTYTLDAVPEGWELAFEDDRAVPVCDSCLVPEDSR